MGVLISADPRIDPRLKTVFEGIEPRRAPDVADRQHLLAEAETEANLAAEAASAAFLATAGGEAVAPSKGLSFRVERLKSCPDDNIVHLQLIRPETSGLLPCVYYIHGGGMQALSCFDANYQAWGRMIAACGVAVAMIDFRNALRPSSIPEVAPYPAGLNDCVSALKWLHANAAGCGVEAERIVVAGDSGGGNLALATAMKLKREGDIGLISGVYALAPFIAGRWPSPDHPSSTENEGLFLNLHHNRHPIAYGIEAFEARDPLAWPGFGSLDDVRGLPPVAINVNECDPLRDEGVAFYRLLLRAGVQARCRQSMGTIHATEVFPAWCPDVSRSCAVDIADFAARSKP